LNQKQRVEIPSLESIDFKLKTLELEEDFFEFVKWVFEVIYRKPFIANWHHKTLCQIMMDIYDGKLHHTLINIPPRYSKTEIVIKMFPAWCYAKNPKCNFFHVSYSDDLALDNSSSVKKIIESVEFQERWCVPLKKDSTAKKKWKTEEDGEFGATASGGQVTGFGAGVLGATEFSGAFLIDDPIKPDDAKSDTIRNSINRRFDETFISRLNDKSTPMIIIMQRLHEEDPTGYLLDGNTELKFTHINLPAINEDGPSKYDPRQVGEALWSFKHNEEDMELMRIKSAMVYAGQYQQRPAPKEGNIFQDKHVHFYKTLPENIYFKVHSWDMTFKEQSKSKKGKVDYVVGTEWGKQAGSDRLYLFPDMVREKMGFSKTLKTVHEFARKHPDYKAILIEDKANGSGIIDMLSKQYTDEEGNIWPKLRRVIEVEPNGSKQERLEGQIPMYEAKEIWLPHPSIAPWIEDYINEHKVFPNGKNDDQVDSGTQAIQYLDNVGGMSMKDVNKKKQDPFRKTFNESKRREKGRVSRLKVSTY
jgi:predicted phage terminase large subunit-like protein